MPDDDPREATERWDNGPLDGAATPPGGAEWDQAGSEWDDLTQPVTTVVGRRVSSTKSGSNRAARVLLPLLVGLLLGGIAVAAITSGDDPASGPTPTPRSTPAAAVAAGRWVEGDEASVTGRVESVVAGAATLVGAQVPTSVSCGDEFVVVWTSTTTFQPDGTNAESLVNKRVQAIGRLDRLQDGACVLVASDIEVVGAASASPSPSPSSSALATPKRTASPTPRPSSTPSATRTPPPTATPTAAPTDTPTSTEPEPPIL